MRGDVSLLVAAADHTKGFIEAAPEGEPRLRGGHDFGACACFGVTPERTHDYLVSAFDTQNRFDVRAPAARHVIPRCFLALAPSPAEISFPEDREVMRRMPDCDVAEGAHGDVEIARYAASGERLVVEMREKRDRCATHVLELFDQIGER